MCVCVCLCACVDLMCGSNEELFLFSDATSNFPQIIFGNGSMYRAHYVLKYSSSTYIKYSHSRRPRLLLLFTSEDLIGVRSARDGKTVQLNPSTPYPKDTHTSGSRSYINTRICVRVCVCMGIWVRNCAHTHTHTHTHTERHTHTHAKAQNHTPANIPIR